MHIITNKKATLLLMILLLLSTQACTDIFISGLPLMAAEFHTTISTTNLTLSVYNYSQAIFVLFIGVISDLIGRRTTVLACLILHIIASALIATTGFLSIVIGMRIMQALGSAAIYIVLRLIIKDTMNKKEQIHSIGLFVIGLVLSPMLAPAIGAWLIHYFSWRACFWAIALFEIPLLIWAIAAIQETNSHQKEYRKNFNVRNHFLSYFRILKDRYFLSAALIVGATFAAFYAFISISSYLYIDQYHVKNTNYSYVFIGVALFYLLGNRIMSRLNANNMSAEKIMGWGVSIALLGLALIIATLFSSTIFMVLVLVTIGTCLLRLSTALINPPTQVMVTHHFHEKGSYALGLLTSIQYAFAAIATSLVSGLTLLPSHSFVITTCLFIALSCVGYLLHSRHKMV